MFSGLAFELPVGTMDGADDVVHFADTGKVCRAKNHSVAKTTLKSIGTVKLLQQMQALWPHLALGDLVCVKCKEAARTDERRRSGSRSPSPSRRRDTLELSFSSPIIREEAAQRIVAQDRPALDPDSLTEITDGPLAGLSVPNALQELACTAPRLVQELQNSGMDMAREILSEIGTLLAKQARENAIAVHASSLNTAGQWTSKCAAELDILIDSMPSIERALEMNAWDDCARVFSSDACSILRDFVERIIAVRGDNRNTGRQSRKMKLKKAFHVLLQFGKIRSERCNGLALKMTVFFRAVGTPFRPINVLQQFGLTVSPPTYKTYVDRWISTHYDELLKEIMSRPQDIVIVGDNIDWYQNVSEFTGKRKPTMMNMFGGFVMLVDPPDPALSRTLPPRFELKAYNIFPDAESDARVRSLLCRVLHNVLHELNVDGYDEKQRWEHVGSMEKAKFVTLPTLNRNSSRPSEMWSILQDYVKLLNLSRDQEWTILGDAGTTRNVETVAKLYSRDMFHPRTFKTLPGLFHAEIAIILKILWDHFRPEMKLAAKRLEVKRELNKPSKMYNTFSRVVAFALSAYGGAAWDVFSKREGATVELFVDWILLGLREKQNTESHRVRSFLAFLAMSQAWKECCRVADGEGVLALIHFLLPYLATLHSSTYFAAMSRFVCEVRSSSPYDRAKKLASLFVNLRGKRGGAKPGDLEMEYQVCAQKRQCKEMPNVTPEFFDYISKVNPLFRLTREDIELEFEPARISTKRTIGRHERSILNEREVVQNLFSSFLPHVPDAKAKSKKDSPLLFLNLALVQDRLARLNGKFNTDVSSVAPNVSGAAPNSEDFIDDEQYGDFLADLMETNDFHTAMDNYEAEMLAE